MRVCFPKLFKVRYILYGSKITSGVREAQVIDCTDQGKVQLMNPINAPTNCFGVQHICTCLQWCWVGYRKGVQ